MDIYVIRHGETDWNAQRKLQGQEDIPLNEKGRRLAAVTAEAMKDIPFAAAYSRERFWETGIFPLCRMSG